MSGACGRLRGLQREAAILPPGSEILLRERATRRGADCRVDVLYPGIDGAGAAPLGRQDPAVRPIGTSHEVEFRRPDGTEGSVRLVNPHYGAEPDVDACVALPGCSGKDLNENFRLTWYPGDVAYLKIRSLSTDADSPRPSATHSPRSGPGPANSSSICKKNLSGTRLWGCGNLLPADPGYGSYGPVSRSRIYDAALAARGIPRV